MNRFRRLTVTLEITFFDSWLLDFRPFDGWRLIPLRPSLKGFLQKSGDRESWKLLITLETCQSFWTLILFSSQAITSTLRHLAPDVQMTKPFLLLRVAFINSLCVSRFSITCMDKTLMSSTFTTVAFYFGPRLSSKEMHGRRLKCPSEDW